MKVGRSFQQCADRGILAGAESEAVDIGHAADREGKRVVAVLEPRVRVGAAIEQHADDIGIAIAGGHQQGIAAAIATCVDIGAIVQQRDYRRFLILVDGVQQRRPTIDSAALVGIGALPDQAPDPFHISIASRADQRGHVMYAASGQHQRNDKCSKPSHELRLQQSALCCQVNSPGVQPLDRSATPAEPEDNPRRQRPRLERSAFR
jgi:hypothetical protein